MTEYISMNKNAPVVVLFGGNPNRRDEVIRNIITIGDMTIYGTLSEEEGLERIQSLPKVDIVLIGGRYSEGQRIRIRKFVADHLPMTKVTEPGLDYPYETGAINNDIRIKLNLGSTIK